MPSSKPHDPRLPESGAIIAGKYEVVRIVGEGGMGVVYEAVHVKMKQRVALKMLLPDTLELPDVVARFEREARASGQLRSRHTARVMDVDQTPQGLPYIVMEYLEGQDLGSEIDTRGRVPFSEAVDYVLQACVAVAEAHDVGIVHRDLKPSNLFLSTGPDGVLVKLLDFGISKVTTEADKLTSAESVMGTPLYMSPEQVRSARNVDARTDIWALGVILYELVTGTTPFSGTTTQVAAAVVTEDVPPILTDHGAPAALQDVVLRALRKDKDQRYQNVRELAVALLPFAPPQSTGVAGIESLLASTRGNGRFQPPISRPGLAVSMPPPAVRAQTDNGDKTVVTGPVAVPVPVERARPRTEQTWTRGGDRKKSSSAFVLFGLVAIAMACVVVGGVVLASRLRGMPLFASRSSVKPAVSATADSSATADPRSALAASASATLAVASPDPVPVVVPTVAASTSAAVAAIASVKAPSGRPKSGVPAHPSAPAVTAATPATTTTAPAQSSGPFIPHHL